MAPGRPALTEAEYKRYYNIIRNDVNAAVVSCYTHRLDPISTFAHVQQRDGRWCVVDLVGKQQAVPVLGVGDPSQFERRPVMSTQ